MNSASNQKKPKDLILYFQIHQPRRLANFSYFDIGTAAPYFDDENNEKIIKRIASECYLPTNDVLQEIIEKYPATRVTFSISGIALEQFQHYCPEVIASFKALAATGAVEFLAETYYHSLAGIEASDEFEKQVAVHAQKIQELFGVVPSFIRNTELIYDNEIGRRAARLGYKGVLFEGVDQALKGKSSFQTYHHPEFEKFVLLPRSCSLSDDIGFRFKQGEKNLTVEDYISWLKGVSEENAVITLGLDYETFGEHQKYDTGILGFLYQLLRAVNESDQFFLTTPSVVADRQTNAVPLSVETTVSWADREKDLSAWLGNGMQKESFDLLQKRRAELHEDDAELISAWRYLQTSDHFYYMCTKKFADGGVHSYFSPYSSPYEAFINYMNVLSDCELLIARKREEARLLKDNAVVLEAERRDKPVPIWVEELKSDYIQNH